MTHAYDDKGNPAGVLPEQVPYQEWLHSDYALHQHLPVLPHAAG